jgi:hypothetical protein
MGIDNSSSRGNLGYVTTMAHVAYPVVQQNISSCCRANILRSLGFQSLPTRFEVVRAAGSWLVSEPAGQVGGRARRHSLWTSQPSTTSTNAKIPVG